jgi:hypothetical protein
METKYYVNAEGDYVGAFCGANPPNWAIEVDSPPAHGFDKWVNGAWVPHVPVQSKSDLLASITVTTQSGNTFDGNETARNNMMSAIMAADIIGQTESDWKLANNTVAHITLDELKEALALSIQRVGEIVLAN